MNVLEISTFFIYFFTLIILTIVFYHKQKSDTDFVIGSRSLNCWLTALSAQASDMSNWLFMGYPVAIFTFGVFNSWAALGLIVFMFLNWHFIAPKVRTATGKMNNLTLSSYFETRFNDKSGNIRIISAVMSFLFFSIYISAGLMGLGYLVESLFGLSYLIGISLGLLIVVFYVFLGGYVTVAWIDLFQGLFLLGVVLYISIHLLFNIGGFSPIMKAIQSQHLSSSLFPNFSGKTLLNILFVSAGWGLGYFGQPHIITKFMGIKM
jgi:Na+/proline symporter